MKDRLSLTLFTYTPDMTISETPVKQYRTAPQRAKTKAIGESIILRLFAEYGFLNQNMIQRCLNMRGHRRIDAARALDKMQYTGKVKKYTIRRSGSKRQDIDIYCLSETAIKQLKKSGIQMIRYKQDMTDIPYILEHLSVAQWHIAVLEVNTIYESAYMLRMALKDGRTGIIPSLTAHTALGGKKVYLCGVCAPKGGLKEDLARFLKNVYMLDAYFKEEAETYRSYVFIAICEDDRQSEELCRYLTSIKETAGMYFLYTNDAVTSSAIASPTTLLYDLSLSGNTITRSVVSFPETTLEALRRSKHKKVT